MAEFGVQVCGVSLAHSPPVDFTQIRDQPIRQRETLLLCFKYLGAQPAATLHLPDCHRDIIERVYGQFNAARDIRPGGPVPDEAGEIAIHYEPEWGYATIAIRRIGSDTVTEVAQARRDLAKTASVPAIYLVIPLAQAAAPEVCRGAESNEFFLSGIAPHFAPDGDALRLQYLQTTLDTLLLQIFSPFGQDLLGYIERERQRVGLVG